MNCKSLYLLGSALLAFWTFEARSQSPQELLRFAQTDYSLTTARSAAMGGAFASLGADPVSMSLNPAGLGMYSRSEITLTGALRITDSEAQFGTNGPIYKGNYTKPIVNNFGFVYADQYTGWRVGFGMNRLADFSGKYSVESPYSTESMAYVFRDKLQGLQSKTLEAKSAPYLNYAPWYWDAILGYGTWLINPFNEKDPNNTDYGVSPAIVQGDRQASRLTSTTNGAVDEFTISTAYNYNNMLFFGFTLGLQNIFYRQNTSYEEFSDLAYNYGYLDSFGLGDDLALNGFGVNLKVGVTVRPVDWLRVGVAYHSPTWISMHEWSVRDMTTWWRPESAIKGSKYDYSADLVQDYQNQTPSRLTAGLSVTIARRVILSADYEAAWYKDMLYTTGMNWSGWRSPVAPTDIDNDPTVSNYTNMRNQIDVNGMIRDSYRQTNTVRLGVEAQPVDKFFLRAGYSYSDSPYAARPSFYTNGASQLSDYGALTQWSGGLGYRSGTFGVDFVAFGILRPHGEPQLLGHFGGRRVVAFGQQLRKVDEPQRIVDVFVAFLGAFSNYFSKKRG